MIEGRKKETIPLQETVVRNPSVNCSVTARNLRTNDLGGVIFGCTRHTMKECLSNQIFGLPSSHMVYVKNVKPGLPLFLFNYSDRKIHGIYEAASNGEMNINPYGWTEDGQDRTQNPAQVRICIRKQCMPLSENQYKPIVIDNYYAEDYFWFELDHAQTGQLISLFESLPVAVSVYPQNADKQKWASKLGKKVKSSETVSDSIVTQLIQHEAADESQAKLPQYSSGWNVLRDMSSDPCENKEDSPGTSDSEDDTPWDERNNFELGLSSATLCEDVKNLEPDLCENVKNLEPDLDKVEEVNEEELVYRKLLQLVNEREKARCDLTGDKDNVGVSCDLNASPADFNCEPEAPLVNSEKHEVVSTNSSDTRFSSPTSLDVQSIVDQLRQEVEEVKVQQLQKTSLFEMKLTKAEIHVQKLIGRVKELESQLIPSTACVQSLETCSADKSQLIPSTASTAYVESLETCSADTMDMEGFLGNNKLVFLFGGYDGTTWLSNVDCYSPISDTMKRLGPTNLACSHAAAAALCGDIYIIGGGDGTVWCNTVESYNPQRNEWTSRPSLARKKGCLSGVTLGSKIYAIGGGDGVTCFSDVEMFDPALGRWIPTQSMLQRRFSSAVAELNGAIYAAGGYDGEGYLNSAERFDPREVVSWSSIPSMNIRRGCHSLVAMNDKIYALGGYNGANMVSSVEEFDPRNNSWIARDEMKEARGYATAAVFGESIFVISGLKDGKVLTETVECYKEGEGWSVANLKGAGKRCFFSAICM
ncbi:hypothetical protein C5167_037153 [Papaver somniferum]|uniref:DCD domain-containing protein n=1 Tax=Papaver somniferum TaxID=3469 RepID=A0A4Y7I986_PAPSO|nr:kelch-like protein 12 [Papaver somniferum]XP_026389437.1 kelch-like protein 12 [Papaver somniferum]XP_026389445.1 kelch-like protein 12 [Papaver somniferum]XP_026389451.1 kelch-like protein 12 [Papaver somniferum]RZC44201.1 hypothetical protein C5167_037153 [Papaver somniferum]